MSTRSYELTIIRKEPNPNYDPVRRGITYSQDMIQTEELIIREVTARITEDELDIIKQALLKVWK